jgi:hypothetical protein
MNACYNVHKKNCYSLIAMELLIFVTMLQVKKDYERLDLMIIYLWNFAHVKKRPRKKSSRFKFSNSFQVMKFISNVFKTFVNTLCYNNDENCEFFIM